MELVNKDMGALALLPVQRHAVEHGVRDHQQPGGLELGTEAVNIEHHDTLVEVYIGLLAEDIQRAGGIEFKGQRDLLRFRLRLLQQHIAEGAESRNRPGVRRIAVHIGDTAVDDRLVLRSDALLVDLLNQRHNELGLYDNGVVFTVPVHHIHGIQSVSAAGRHTDHRAEIAHSFNKRRVFSLGVTDQNVIVGVQNEEGNQFLCRERLTGAGDTEQECGLVQEICLIAHDEIVGNGIFTEVNAALIHDLLHLERHQHRKALRGESSEGIDFSRTDGEHRIQSIRLLILQRRHLAHVLSRCRQHRFRIQAQLFLGVCGNHHCDHRKHHALVTGGQVVQKLFGFLALKLHVVGNNGGEIVVLILPSLPAGDVRFHAQQEALHLTDSFISGNGNHINGEHEIAV